jgi:hypothetical protein
MRWRGVARKDCPRRMEQLLTSTCIDVYVSYLGLPFNIIMYKR